MRVKYLIRMLARPGWRLFAAAAATSILTLGSALAAHASTTFSASASSGNNSNPCTLHSRAEPSPMS